MTAANQHFVVVRDDVFLEVSATLEESKHLITVNMDLSVFRDAAGKVHVQMWFDALKHAQQTKTVQSSTVALSVIVQAQWQSAWMGWKKILIFAIRVVNARVMHAWIVDVHQILDQ